VLGVPELADDPRFTEEKTMMIPENKAALVKIFEERFAGKTSAEWDKLLTEADIVHDRLIHYKEITKNEQARVNHFVEEVTFGNGTKAWLPRPSVLSENLGLPEYKLSPALGADTRSILTDLGYSEAEINKMLENRLIKV